MKNNVLRWITGVLAAIAVGSLPASAQDFGSLKGGPTRTGKNTLPNSSGPGQANLRWFYPNAASGPQGFPITRDNLSASQTSFIGPWVVPDQADEALGAFYPTFQSTIENSFSGYDELQAAYVGNVYPDAYRYMTTVASAVGDDPTVKQNPGDTTGIHTWLVQPADPGQRVPRNYALYAYLPSGPTVNGRDLRYPQRYYVYEIIYGDNQRFVDVVDSYVAGAQFIRLGGGGITTNRIFSYNGVNPIQIRLHNTVPRNANGNLTDTPGITLVYADAIRAVPEIGSYNASPTISQIDPANVGSPVRTVAALNESTLGFRDGEPVNVQAGRVTSYEFNTGNPQWSFSPLVESENTNDQDNSSAGVNAQVPWTTATVSSSYRGANYHRCDIDVNDPSSPPSMVYTPTLEDGNYEIYAWLPGSSNGELYGRAIQYELHEGTTITTVNVDQDAARGWVRLGTRRFNHDVANARLRVYVTNYSTDAGDAGRFAYADTIRFVGATNIKIDSTPVQVKALVNYPGLGVVERGVVIVAAENGRIYCLDGQGNADGTTNVIWTYPSTPDPNTSDPNAVAGEDFNTAEMPTGFGFSSATVARVDGKDYLYIGSANGRVYCIDMEGRGDGNFATRRPGTTRRIWSYPDDYPATPRTTSLGSFVGSVAFENTAQGPTVFVPAPQGRMYALDARAGTNKTTSVRWAYPALTSQTLGEITSTPAVEFGRVYFGTAQKSGDDRGRFFALNMDTGAVVWQFNGSTAWSSDGSFVNADDFISGPATADAAISGQTDDVVFVANSNRFISALNADTGALIWTSAELSAVVTSNLTWTPMRVLNNAGFPQVSNVLMVPTADGRFVGLFSDLGQLNRLNTRRCWQATSSGATIPASIAVGRGWMSAVDDAGGLFNYNDGTGYITPGVPPGGVPDIIENNRVGDIWRETEIKLVNKATYQRLRLPDGAAQLFTYDQFKQLAEFNRPDNAYDWGETMYIAVYKFPYARLNNNLPPPIINYAFSVEGTNIRNISLESRKFRAGPGQDTVTDPISGQVYDLDGFCVLAFTFQGGGASSLPPGNGRVQISINSSLTGSSLNIVPNPTRSRRDFKIANPIALVMRSNGAGVPDPQRSLGYTAIAGDPENLMNGSNDLPATAKNEGAMGTSAGVIGHARAGNVTIGIVDRSMMTLLRGPGRGLDNIRIGRSDLEWTGGSPRVAKPLDFGTFPNYEDLPVNFPNDSLDYPNIRRELLKVVKDAFGQAENPIFNAVTLTPPTNVDENNPAARTLVPTPFTLDVSVPKYQPANQGTAQDSANTSVDAGYFSQLDVFVDSNGDGRRTRFGSQREAFRNFFLGASVPVDESVEVTTPTVNLGSLAGGTGYDPRAPWQSAIYSPFGGAYSTTFKQFTVRNTGNVNMLNMRVAKGYDTGGAVSPWELYSLGNSDRAWLDGGLHLHSDIDTQFAIPPSPILQKARVEDRVPTTLSINPIRRANANLNVSGNAQDPANWFNPSGPAPRDPSISVSIPIGFPVGEYSGIIRVIEDRNNNQSLQLDGNGNGVEPYTDPSFVLNFKVRESRLTNSFTPFTAPMIDVPGTLGTGGNFQHQNSAPTMVRGLTGDVAIAFSSDRNTWLQPQPNTPNTNGATRIYVGNLNGVAPGGGIGPSPLQDLNGFQPSSRAQWFEQQVGSYPTQPADILFDSQAGETIVAGTARYTAPSFPSIGFVNPFTGATSNSVYMAFLGNAQKQTATRRIDESRLFIASYNGQSLGAPVGLPFDPEMSKGKPSVVQAGNRATVFYGAAGTGQGQIHYATFDGGNWNQPRRLEFGRGFENVGQPSAYGRIYEGAGTSPSAGTPIIELAFSGKLLGRPASDIWLARMRTDGNGVPNVGNNGITLLFPTRPQEQLEATGETGSYRSRGVGYGNVQSLVLEQDLNGTVTNLERPGRTFDPNTGLLTFPTTLGGQVNIDVNMGTVRFTGTVPSNSARLLLTYQARVLRVTGSGTTGANMAPSLVFDNRLIGDFGFWARSNNSAIQNTDQVRSGRYVITYGRAATGVGQASRPYMQTLRYAIQLPTAVHTQPGGNVTSIQVVGATSFYQVDPAAGKVYFTDADEARNVTVNYTGLNEADGTPLPGTISVAATVQLKAERLEAPVPIEQAVNESQMSLFLDPFDNINPASRRPGLVWMAWTSTRTSGPDLFLQSIAPRFSPVINNR